VHQNHQPLNEDVDTLDVKTPTLLIAKFPERIKHAELRSLALTAAMRKT
jgi:hypothetical protein